MTLTGKVVGVVAGHDAASAWNRWDHRADRYWHKSSSALLSLIEAQLFGLVLWQQAVAVVLGLTFGGGVGSPDVDQFAWFKRLTPYLFPRKTLRRLSGHGDPLSHHMLTHNPVIALAAELTVGMAWWMLGGPLAWIWVPMGICQQWIHHDLGDVLIGKGMSDYAIERGSRSGVSPTGVMIPRGVPLVWWWRHVGLGWFKSGGFTCRVLTVACWPAMAWLVWVHR